MAKQWGWMEGTDPKGDDWEQRVGGVMERGAGGQKRHVKWER